jgi:hypothetical protein
MVSAWLPDGPLTIRSCALANLVALRRLGFIVIRDECFFGWFCADLFVALRILELLDLRSVFVPLGMAASAKIGVFGN